MARSIRIQAAGDYDPVMARGNVSVTRTAVWSRWYSEVMAGER